MPASALAPADGRAARSHRARAAVVDALLNLLSEGVVKPTAAQIAERAEVSLRLVFHHFADLEALHAEAADRQTERLRPLMKRISPTLPFDDKLAEFVRNRARLYETITPVRRASLRMEPFSPELARRLDRARGLARAEVRRVFTPELDALADADRRETFAALDAATSWPAWEVLRRHQRLGDGQARKVMARTIRALLEPKR
jgi:TetR/AcrR family transcriptional regulator, regulator of autoinduction and epiphytic fitness